MKKLTKNEMKMVMGGLHAGGGDGRTVCSVWTTDINGQRTDTWIAVDGSGSSASNAANNHCVNLIVTQGTGVYHCGYNCESGAPEAV